MNQPSVNIYLTGHLLQAYFFFFSWSFNMKDLWVFDFFFKQCEQPKDDGNVKAHKDTFRSLKINSVLRCRAVDSLELKQRIISSCRGSEWTEDSSLIIILIYIPHSCTEVFSRMGFNSDVGWFEPLSSEWQRRFSLHALRLGSSSSSPVHHSSKRCAGSHVSDWNYLAKH